MVIRFFETGDVVKVTGGASPKSDVWHLESSRIAHKYAEGSTWIWLTKSERLEHMTKLKQAEKRAHEKREKKNKQEKAKKKAEHEFREKTHAKGTKVEAKYSSNSHSWDPAVVVEDKGAKKVRLTFVGYSDDTLVPRCHIRPHGLHTA